MRAICCVVGTILINLTLGTFYSFGNILPYVASYMRNHGNPSVTIGHATWLTAAFLLGQGISVILGAWIEQCYNSRVAIIIGCTIHCTSTYLTIWTVKSSFLAFTIVYGFGSGFGSGSAYIASIIAAQKWYPAQKGFFTGLIVAGFGLGGLIFTNLQTLYINPNNVASDSTGYYSEEVYEKVPNLFLYMALIFTVLQILGCVLAFPPDDSQPEASHRVDPSSTSAHSGVIIDEGLPEIKNALSPFKHRVFYIIGLMMILIAPGVTFVNSLGKLYGQTYIQDDQYLATVISIAAIANAGGRLTWGCFMDKCTFSTCFSFMCMLFAFLVALFPFSFILASKLAYMIWMFGLFFGFSGGFVLFPVFVEQVFGAKYSGMIYGLLFICLALSSIFTSFIIQISVADRLSDKKATPTEKLLARFAPCAIIAASYCISFIIYFSTLPVRRIENAIMRRKEAEITKTIRPSLF